MAAPAAATWAAATQTPRTARRRAGAARAGRRAAPGARHKVFPNTARRPAKFSAGLTRKRR